MRKSPLLIIIHTWWHSVVVFSYLCIINQILDRFLISCLNFRSSKTDKQHPSVFLFLLISISGSTQPSAPLSLSLHCTHTWNSSGRTDSCESDVTPVSFCCFIAFLLLLQGNELRLTSTFQKCQRIHVDPLRSVPHSSLTLVFELKVVLILKPIEAE